MIQAHHTGTLRYLASGPHKCVKGGTGPKPGVLAHLRTKGWVEQDAGGWWSLTPRGRETLAALERPIAK